MDESQQDEVKSCLEKALEQCNNSDLIQTILNLAEFMDHSEKVITSPTIWLYSYSSSCLIFLLGAFLKQCLTVLGSFADKRRTVE